MTPITELPPEKLNNLAAMAQGWVWHVSEWTNPLDCGAYWVDSENQTAHRGYDPCNNWGQAGALVEKYEIDLNWLLAPDMSGVKCSARAKERFAGGSGLPQRAVTPTRAIVLAVVASRYGNKVDYDEIIGGEK